MKRIYAVAISYIIDFLLIFPFSLTIRLVYILRCISFKSYEITVEVDRFDYKCLKKALIVVLVSHQRPTVYFGVKKGEFGMEAHAWSKVGDRFLTGWEGHEEFKVIATFD